MAIDLTKAINPVHSERKLATQVHALGPWDFYTDGVSLVAVQAEGTDRPGTNLATQGFTLDGIKVTGSLLSVASVGQRVTREALLKWLEGVDATMPAASKCDCKTGEIACECGECGHEHTYKCPECDGTGSVLLEPDADRGTVLGVTVNRRFMARAMRILGWPEPLGVEKIKIVSGGFYCIRLHGTGWIVAVMQMSDISQGLPTLEVGE